MPYREGSERERLDESGAGARPHGESLDGADRSDAPAADVPAPAPRPQRARRRRREAAHRLEAKRREAPRAQYEDVRAQIQTGDLLFYRGRSLASRLIRRASYSVYSHVAIAAWWAGHLVVFESTGHGGVAVRPARRAVYRYDGQVDWWSLRPALGDVLDRDALLRRAVAELGKPYARLEVLKLGWKLLFGGLLGRRDPVGAPEGYFCSQYVSRCFREGGVDLVTDARDADTSPGAIVRSGQVELRAVLRRGPR